MMVSFSKSKEEQFMKEMSVIPKEKGHGKSAPTTPEIQHSLSPVAKVRHHSVANQSPSRKISYKDETLKFREYNLFSKKVPKDAEAANIQVGVRSSDRVVIPEFL